MTIYNVAVPVVALIEAETPAAALAAMRERLTAAGFDPYKGELPTGADAFESEPV